MVFTNHPGDIYVLQAKIYPFVPENIYQWF